MAEITPASHAGIDIECVVIGAGVIGLAVARALACTGREVIVLEAQGAIGTGTSSRNSEVIHAGLYYPPDSLKARYCVRGREMLYSYCERRGVAHRRLGKLVVAHDKDEIPVLDQIARRAERNGVGDLEYLNRAQIEAMEPALNGHAALLSPSAGIIDAHSLMLALQGEAEDHGAIISFQTLVLRGAIGRDCVTVDTGGQEPSTLRARCVVNAAGLASSDVASRFAGLAGPQPKVSYAKGNYFGLASRAPFSRLIYPVPEPGGLGVHLTLDMAGRARFGPDVEWVDEIDYAVDPARGKAFYKAIRRYWPGLPDGSLFPDYSGIRPKIVDQEAADFMIDTGNGNLINLHGIELPGLTSCMAIADDVAAIVGDRIG